MKKKSFLVLCLVLMLAIVGCSNSATVMTVDNTKFSADRMTSKVYRQLANYVGNEMGYDETDDVKKMTDKIAYMVEKDEQIQPFIDLIKKSILQSEIASAAAYDKAKAENIVLTEEELATIKKDAEAFLKSFEPTEENLKTVIASKYEDEENAENKAKIYLIEAKKAIMLDYGFENDAAVEEFLKKDVMVRKLFSNAVSGITIDDAAIKAEYDKKLAEQQKAFDENVSSYEQAISSGETVVYVPAGVKRVKHILLTTSAENQKIIDDLNTAISELSAVTTPTDEQKAQLEAKNAELTAAKATADAETKKRADDLYTRIKNGEDYDALLLEFGQDPGMKEGGAGYKDGYTVTAKSSYLKEFLQAALNLKKVGDVTKPVKTDSGYHIIKQTADVKSGAVALDTVQEALKTTLLEAKQLEEIEKYSNELYNSYKEQGKFKIDFVNLKITEEYFNKVDEEAATQE